jgi:hypothetical protein
VKRNPPPVIAAVYGLSLIVDIILSFATKVLFFLKTTKETEKITPLLIKKTKNSK